jgi:hypothetical protein
MKLVTYDIHTSIMDATFQAYLGLVNNNRFPCNEYVYIYVKYDDNLQDNCTFVLQLPMNNLQP